MSNTCEVNFDSIAVASSFDDCLKAGLDATSDPDHVSGYILNMSALEFTDLQNMQRIICFTEYCFINSKNLSLVLPTDKKLLRFWHSWNFFEVVENLACKPLTDLVPENQHKILEFDGEPNPDDETVKLLAADIVKSRRQNFFSFFVDHLENTSKNSLPAREKGYWERQEVVDVLHRVFGENFGDNIGSDIVSETLFNSTRHSNAKFITSASFCKKAGTSGGTRSFQLVIWDNGEPIYETLRKPLVEGHSVREYSARNFKERKYLVNYPEYPGKLFARSSHSDEITKEDKDSQLILSALFPGVTSKPFSDQDLAYDGAEKREEIRIQRGMGFDFVLETAIHGLGGRVSIRSGRYFVQIEKVKDNNLRDHIRKTDKDFVGKKRKPVPNSLLKMYHRDHFSVSFRQIPDIVPPLNGNLIFISV